MTRLLLALALSATTLAQAARVEAIQYIAVNLQASEINEMTFKRIAELDEATTEVRVGAAAIFSYLNEPPESLCKRLEHFLVLSRRYKVPVVVQPDGEQWWGARPDLWNWWDEEKPGYDPENRTNVEWTGWRPEDAVKIAWRNWGRQIRVLPPPNLMSPIYRKACREEMGRILPMVMDWWRGLPEEEKDLLIAVKLGWESSIGVNSYYYPNGNSLLEKSASEDPAGGVDTEQIPSRGVAALGYAAVKTAGLANSGVVQEAHQVDVVRRHLEDLCRVASELGVPRERLFTHVGGWKEGELLYDAARNAYSCPGWSFYRHARSPAEDTGVRRGLEASDAPWWGAVEWLPQGAESEADWEAALRATLALGKCRYLCVYNWRDVAENEQALAAIRNVSITR